MYKKYMVICMYMYHGRRNNEKRSSSDSKKREKESCRVFFGRIDAYFMPEENK
jgi:hypothetical protein